MYKDYRSKLRNVQSAISSYLKSGGDPAVQQAMITICNNNDPTTVIDYLYSEIGLNSAPINKLISDGVYGQIKYDRGAFIPYMKVRGIVGLRGVGVRS